MKVTIYHSPRCSKSRETLNLLRDRELTPEIVEYQREPISITTLERLLSLLKMSPRQLVRSDDDLYKQNQDTYDQMSDQEIKQLLIAKPALMQRPIVEVEQKRAAIGRPPENVLEILP